MEVVKEKKCHKCGIIKDIRGFPIRSKVKGTFGPYCKECHRKYNREYHKNKTIECKKEKVKKQRLRLYNRREWLYDYLYGRSCKDCGEDNIVVLQFHHIKNKSINVTEALIRGYSKDNIKKEIEKCEVLCANCHIKRTAKKFNWHKLNYMLCKD
jgi:hypothetical protein